ncbi:uncharacterized protein LOC144907500 [Branchiostoma floridae x Branchiostoma belcheri]
MIKGLQNQMQKLKESVDKGKETWKLISKNVKRIDEVMSQVATISASLQSLEQAFAAQAAAAVGDSKKDGKGYRSLKEFEEKFHREMARQERLLKVLDRQEDVIQQRLNDLEKTSSSSAQNCNNLRQKVERNTNEVQKQNSEFRQQERRLSNLVTEMNSLGSVLHSMHEKKGGKVPVFPGLPPHNINVQADVSRLQAQVDTILATLNAEKSKSDRLFALISELQHQKDGRVAPNISVQPKYKKVENTHAHYKDDKGHTYYKDDKGKAYYKDDKGHEYYKGDKGQTIYRDDNLKVDANGNVHPKYQGDQDPKYQGDKVYPKRSLVNPSDDDVQPQYVKAHYDPFFAKGHLNQPNVANLSAVITDLQGQVQRLQERPYVGHCEVGMLGLKWNAEGKNGYGGTAPVNFSKMFRTVPVVSAALYRLYHTGYQPVGIVVGTDKITEKGFLLKIHGWDQTKLYSAGVQWMACG